MSNVESPVLRPPFKYCNYPCMTLSSNCLNEPAI
jgi:hypothetical protein